MTVFLDLPGLCVNSLCHKQVTLDILRREVKTKKNRFFPPMRQNMLWQSWVWRVENKKTWKIPGTTFLKWRLKWWPEGLHCPLYSWQHLLVHKVTTGNILDGLSLLLEHKMEIHSPTMRCLKGYDPRLVSRENRAICQVSITFPSQSTALSLYTKKKKSLTC